MIRAAMFDLDGTLADTIESMASATNGVLMGFGYSPIEASKFNYFAGDGAATLVKRALLEAGDTELIHFDRAYEEYKKFFKENCTYKVRVFDGIKETLEEMKKKKIKLAVLTNKPHERAVEVIEYLFGKDYFDVVLGEQEGIAKKPSAEGANKVLEELEVLPEECLYVGDTNVDMQTGKNANMPTVGVLWGFRTREELEENHADAIVAEPTELLNYINDRK